MSICRRSLLRRFSHELFHFLDAKLKIPLFFIKVHFTLGLPFLEKRSTLGFFHCHSCILKKGSQALWITVLGSTDMILGRAEIGRALLENEGHTRNT